MRDQEKKRKYPLLLALVTGVLPFIVRMYVFSAGIAEESWYPYAEDVMADFFSCYKSAFFTFLAALMLISILQRYRKDLRVHGKQVLKQPWLSGTLFMAFCLLSACMSVDVRSSLLGNYYRFEPLTVQTGYIILCLYAFLASRDRQVVYDIFKVLLAVAAVMLVCGILQMAGKDPFLSGIIQRLVIPHGLWDTYLGQLTYITDQAGVYLTLGNPDTASMYTALLLIVLGGCLFTTSGKMRLITGTVWGGLFIILLRTRSRVGLLMLFAAALSLLWNTRTFLKDKKKTVLIMAAAVTILYLLGDGAGQFAMTKRLRATVSSFRNSYVSERLSEIETTEEAIKIVYDGDTVYLTYEPGSDLADGGFYIFDKDRKNITERFDEYQGQIDKRGWEDVYFYPSEEDDEAFLLVQIEDNLWYFTYVDDVGYMIYTGNGKYDTVGAVKQCGFHNLKHLASGRPYIWSRTFPLLKQYGLAGSGQDTFFEVFPQNDYVGKSIYTSSMLTVVEKPHNMYLQIAVQNGIPALISLMVFIGYYYYGFFRRKETGDKIFSVTIFAAVTAYLTGMFFNDSVTTVSTLFFVLLGFGFRYNFYE